MVYQWRIFVSNVSSIALRIYGKDWKKVEYHIGTRSGAQIRSHAQKFFLNIEKTKKMTIDQYIDHIKKDGTFVTPTRMNETATIENISNRNGEDGPTVDARSAHFEAKEGRLTVTNDLDPCQNDTYS